MKKQLLSAALLLGASVAFSFNVAAKSAMDHELKLDWMSTDISNLSLDARQGFGKNGKFYLQNKLTKNIEVWSLMGKEQEIPSGGGTNITFDDAGNVIVRIGTFPDIYSTTNPEFRVFSPDFKTSKDVKSSNISTSGRVDFWGHVGGDVLTSDEGGILLMGTQWTGQMSEINIVRGVENTEYSTMHQYFNPLKIGGQITTTTLMSAWKQNDGSYEMAILVPSAETVLTDKNTIQKMVYDGEYNIIHDSYYITPWHNVCTGFYIFNVGTRKFIIYSSGSNNCDGYSIAELATKKTYEVEDSDSKYRVATKYAETKDDGTPMYESVNAFYGNHLSVEPRDAESAYIYQYVPGAYIARYIFTPDKETGVEGVEEENVYSVMTLDGKIFVEGEFTDVVIYNLNGAVVSKGKAEVEVPAGAYIVSVDGKASKVLVR